MSRTVLGAVVSAALLIAGCGGDDGPSPASKEAGAAPTATVAPTPDITELLRAFERDALAIDRRARVVDPGPGTKAFVHTLYDEETFDSGRGTMFMEASLTIRYPQLTAHQHGKKLLRLFEEHGFGKGITYDVDDFAHGQVQRSDDLRCRIVAEPDASWLRCVPFAFFDLVEQDVAGAVTSLYHDETGDMDNGCWEVTYPHGHAAEPPVVAILRTGVCDGTDQYRAYLYEGDRWRRVARARSYAALGTGLARVVCRSDDRGAFPTFCPGAAA